MNATQYADAYYHVAAEFMFTHDEFFGRSRRQPLALCRQIGMYLARKNTTASLADIGAAFGRRGYDTVIWARKRVVDQMTVSRKMRGYINGIEQSVKNNLIKCCH